MASMVTEIEFGRPFTTDDLDAMPDDGRRYELVDGVLLVSPAPGWPHQEAGLTLYGVLRAACPRELRVIAAPFAVRPDEHNELQPDVLVARYDDLAPGAVPVQSLPVAPLLAVEVISPCSRLTDPTLKKAAYARLGVRSFWLLDPDPRRPALTAFELHDGTYREVASIAGGEPFAATEPFPVTIVPADLVRGLLP